MAVVKPTIKGQILIPSTLRKKYKITKDTPLHIYEEKKKIILELIQVDQDPVKEGMGILKTKGRILKTLLAERKKEAGL